MPVVVQRSRVKIVLAVLGCVGFVALSLLLLALGSAASRVVGVLGVLTFGAFGVGWLTLLFRGGPGLVVDDEGFDDGSSGVSVGRVEWSDVTTVDTWGVLGSSFVVVRVRHPRAYLARLGWLWRPAAWANWRLVGSPVTVGSVGLRTGFDGLHELLLEGFEQYRLRPRRAFDDGVGGPR